MKGEFKRPDYQGVMKSAEKLFKQAGLRTAPPTDIEKAAKLLGVRILRSNLEGDVSGYLFVSKGSEPIIGVNANHPDSRQRFTIAHELGHLMLHAPTNDDISFVDKSFFIVNRDGSSSLGIETREIEANFFAAEVLMPAECLYRDLTKVKNPAQSDAIYQELAERYGVSKEAMSFRLNNLGFIRL